MNHLLDQARARALASSPIATATGGDGQSHRVVWAQRLAFELAASPDDAQLILSRFFGYCAHDIADYGFIADTALRILTTQLLTRLDDDTRTACHAGAIDAWNLALPPDEDWNVAPEEATE